MTVRRLSDAVSPSPPWADDLSLAHQQVGCAAQQIIAQRSEMGQKHALPRRSIAVRFTSISRPDRTGSMRRFVLLPSLQQTTQFPPGRFRFGTRPAPTGSPPVVNIIEMVVVAALI